MADDGSDLKTVVSSIAVRVDPPKWSPDGEHLAFIAFADESETNQLVDERYAYVVEFDGSGLTNLGRTWTVPEWSTDGTHLAFVGGGGLGGELGHLLDASLVVLSAFRVVPLQEPRLLSAGAAGAFRDRRNRDIGICILPTGLSVRPSGGLSPYR